MLRVFFCLHDSCLPFICSDIRFVVGEERKTVYAHKCLLAARFAVTVCYIVIESIALQMWSISSNVCNARGNTAKPSCALRDSSHHLPSTAWVYLHQLLQPLNWYSKHYLLLYFTIKLLAIFLGYWCVGCIHRIRSRWIDQGTYMYMYTVYCLTYPMIRLYTSSCVFGLWGIR